jgi:hypothetical protein
VASHHAPIARAHSFHARWASTNWKAGFDDEDGLPPAELCGERTGSGVRLLRVRDTRPIFLVSRVEFGDGSKSTGPPPERRINFMELHLIPDTNPFFEFKALDQLPWAELGADPIVIVLTKPVMDEIDKHKKGTGRTRERALEIFRRIRAMLATGVGEDVVREAGPRVVLRRMTRALPDERLKDHLDYTKTDERLIGIASTLAVQASGYTVKLFTDDVGPAAMADELGVLGMMIDPAWRRPPTETTEGKRLREAEKDLQLYRMQAPKIEIRCAGVPQNGIVRVVRKVAERLTAAEIEEVLDALRLKYPATAGFVPPPPRVTAEPSGEIVTVSFAPPPEAEIAAYADERYPRWLDDCRAVLESLHVGRDVPAPAQHLRWTMSNEGSRPAPQVRVTFEAKGPLRIRRLLDGADEARVRAPPARATAAPTAVLPTPPRPPVFVETVTRTPAPSKPVVGVSLATLRSARPSPAEFAAAASAVRSYDIARIGQGQSHLDLMKTVTEAARRLQDAASERSHLDSLPRRRHDADRHAASGAHPEHRPGHAEGPRSGGILLFMVVGDRGEEGGSDQRSVAAPAEPRVVRVRGRAR